MSKNIEEDNLIIVEAVNRLDIVDIRNLLQECGIIVEVNPDVNVNEEGIVDFTFDDEQFKIKLIELLCD